ncbi:Protein MAINTENANCE OF MERISTEMS [Bienertia sinuspersici]
MFAGSTTIRRDKQRHKFDDSWIVKDSAPGGPGNGTVIPSFNGHVSRLLWLGTEDRGVLKCHSRENMCRNLASWRTRMSEEAYSHLNGSWLAQLSMAMLPHIDAPLISAFVERWQPDTNSFHLPFGEMTIMLHDVWYILRIPIEGRLVDDQSSIDALKGHVAELFDMPIGGLTGGPNGGEIHWDGGGVSITSIDYFCRRRQPTRCDETQLIGWLFLLLGCTLFVDKNKIRPRDIVEALESDSIHEFSWGSAALAYLYRQLGMTSRYSCLGNVGCLTLLQCWIYEYFPCFRPHMERHVIGPGCPQSMLWNVRCEDKSMARLQSIRRRMPYRTDPSKDVPRTLMVGCIRYRDIVEPYMPDQSLRQLGRVQVVPMGILAPEFSMRLGILRRPPTMEVQIGQIQSRAQEIMPSVAGRQACDEVERMISMWNRTLGRQQESQHDNDGSETQ